MQALRRHPDDRKAADYLSLVKEARHAREASQREASAKEALIEVEKAWTPAPAREQPGTASAGRTNLISTTPSQQLISALLF